MVILRQCLSQKIRGNIGMLNKITFINDDEFLCPCCNQTKFHQDEEFDICPICLWQYDKIQIIDPDYCGGANGLSIEEYRKNYLLQKGKR